MTGRVFAEHLVVPPIGHAAGTVALPGSKSISNRVLLLSALSEGTTRIRRLLRADDTQRMLECLRGLGVEVAAENGDGTDVRVTGCAGHFPRRRASLYLGNAGTAARPLTAALSLCGGEYILDGDSRMRERPLGALLDALRALGADISCQKQEGFLPIRIGGRKFPAGAEKCSVPGNVSSQFITALLLSAPVYCGPGGLEIEILGQLISRPYVEMTLRLMRRFGAEVVEIPRGYRVLPGVYRHQGVCLVEGDASAASYFLALGALAGGPVRVTGVGSRSIQGDVAFCRVLEKMGAQIRMGDDWIEASAPAEGALRAVDADCTEIPDAAMTIAAVAAMSSGVTTLSGIASWRVKETDRIAAMQAELQKFGAQVLAGDDFIRITPPERLKPAAVSTYKDHRMAMSLSLLACGGVPVTIEDPGCVSKTFPAYFDELAGLTESGRFSAKP